jgi:release factor glutamine methyltransferase
VAARTWTIRDVLEWMTRDFESRGIESPRLDAELLVASALGVDRIGLYLDLSRPLLEEERRAIRPLITRRREREPVAYILGYRDFYGRRFQVSPDVLIPRPDTESLIEHALELIPADVRARVIDVGTGSGAIAITLAAERPLADITATDISEAALCVATRNADRLGVADRIHFEHGDLLGAGGRYDFVVSNPPYIASVDIAGLQPEVQRHEPAVALEGGEDGLDLVRALVRQSTGATEVGAQMLIEVGAGQASKVASIAEGSESWAYVTTYLDLNRIERVVHLRRT